MFENRALIVGVTGIVGNNLARQLLADGGWEVHGISRKQPLGLTQVNHVAVDVLNAEATHTALAEIRPTHVFFCTWTRMSNEAENCRVNGAMVRNVLAAVCGAANARVQHVALVTGTKNYLGPFEMYAQNRPETPFREDQPRLPIDNFYYVQEDLVYDFARQYGYSWSIHRPHTIVGYAVGNAMNLGVTLAVYASICKALDRPFVFPGSPVQYECLSDVTDARLLARHILWAATTPAARNEAFNVANGDVFRWKRLWRLIANYFDLRVLPQSAEFLPLQKQMADMVPLWECIVQSRGLQPHRLNELTSAWHTDLDLGRPMECVNDMNKSRRFGFSGFQDTERSFLDLFDQLRRERIIP